MQSSNTQVSHEGSSTSLSVGLPMAESDWLEATSLHNKRLEPWANDRLARNSRGEKHPVYDFLFDYNALRPAQLLQWHPGLGVLLHGEKAEVFLSLRHYRRLPGGIGVAPNTFPTERREAVAWILRLLINCRERPPQFGCFGLHEWAMVHRAPRIRHTAYPLRFSNEEVAEVVESLPIRCSHFDAFRFFTPEAQPLNQLQPTRQGQHDLEQRGCLHVNMDLLKWTSKLSPWAPSNLLAETFLLAARIREIDMRASPYDLRSLGFEPIKIETPVGRAEYERQQREFTRLGEPLRERLIDLCRQLLHATNETKTQIGGDRAPRFQSSSQ